MADNILGTESVVSPPEQKVESATAEQPEQPVQAAPKAEERAKEAPVKGFECPECHKLFGSKASRRVHKSRYHRKPETNPTIEMLEAAGTAPFIGEATLDSKARKVEPEAAAESKGERHTGRSYVSREGRRGGGGGLAILGGLGAIAVIIVLAALGKKQCLHVQPA